MKRVYAYFLIRMRNDKLIVEDMQSNPHYIDAMFPGWEDHPGRVVEKVNKNSARYTKLRNIYLGRDRLR